MANELPPCRKLVRQSVRIGGIRCYVDVGFFDDPGEQVGEIFLVVDRTGSEKRWFFDEVARLASKLIQHGCPLEDVAESWLGTVGRINGPVTGHPSIKNCTSVLDFVARMLLIEYCGREDLKHV